jgi:2-oxoglutarate dehydrogenase E2 component (dihydrolipoamide succinyltransferase)
MSTNEESSPLGAAPDDVSPLKDGAVGEGADTEDAGVVDHAADANANPHEALSPAVRRLVRQFDLDITGIHGTGPSGRIRVGDIMGMLAGRTDSGNRDAPLRPATLDDDEAADADDAELEPTPRPHEAAVNAALPTTTVFDCDLSRVLSHRKKLRLENLELLTTSYFLTALAAALDATPEITGGHPPRFGLSLTTTDGDERSSFLDTAAVSWDAAMEDRVRAFDAALRANLDVGHADTNLLVYHYGESGSLLATPTPVGAGHSASVGIGRVRREIALRAVDGAETPRVTARCYLTLSFLAEHVPFHHANRFMAQVVRLLEQWPE